MSQPKPFLELLGRVLVSAIFLVAGLGKVMDWSGTADYMASKGMPAIPIALTMAILFKGRCPVSGRWGTGLAVRCFERRGERRTGASIGVVGRVRVAS